MKDSPSSFNVRVYGLWVRDQQLLVADELIRGREITKFPGGGLEIGEGTLECIVREFQEELNVEVSKAEHFYTTDFYLRSAFNPDHQIISIYYTVEVANANAFDADMVDISHEPELMGLRWIALNELKPESVTLEADRRAVELLLSSF